MSDWTLDYMHLPASGTVRGGHCFGLYRPSDPAFRLVGWGRTREQALAALRERASEYGRGMPQHPAIAEGRLKNQQGE